MTETIRLTDDAIAKLIAEIKQSDAPDLASIKARLETETPEISVVVGTD